MGRFARWYLIGGILSVSTVIGCAETTLRLPLLSARNRMVS